MSLIRLNLSNNAIEQIYIPQQSKYFHLGIEEINLSSNKIKNFLYVSISKNN